MHRPGEGVFGRGSNVLEYWLANSEGFTLARTKSRRQVTGVVIDPETQQARSLVVRRSRRRTQLVAADTITAVDPHGRVLYVSSRRHRSAAGRTQAAAHAARRSAQHGVRASARHAAAARTHATSGLARLRPLAFAAARAVALAAIAVAARVRAIAATVAVTARSLLRRARPVVAAYARGAAVVVAETPPRLACLRPVAAAYAHNVKTVVAACARVAGARLRGPWTPSSPPSWMKRGHRSPAAKSRMPES